MIAAQKELVRTSWKRIVPNADRAAALFYRRLFEIAPGIGGLFDAADMAEQRRKLVQVLNVAVSSLDNRGALAATVADLGRRHAAYGAQNSHYDSVGTALLWMLERELGPAFTPEVGAAWAELYGWLARVMRCAQQEAAFEMSRPAA